MPARDAGAAVARLSAQGLPGLADVRATTLRGEPGALVLSGPGGSVRRITVGSGGVTEAVHVSGPRLAELVPGSLGAVDLRDAEGLRVRLDLRDWLPEHGEVAKPDEALRRSGLREVLEQAGLGLRTPRSSELAETVFQEPGRARLPPAPRLGLPFLVVRAAALLGAFACCLVVYGLGDRGAPAVLVGSLALLVTTAWAAALVVRALVRARRALPPVLAQLEPRPIGTTTARFLRTARLRRHAADVVVVDDLGRERWLPVDGALGVASVAVVRPGTPTAQVELRAADGTPRATLPWDDWSAGAGGDEALRRFVREAGLPLDPAAAPSRRGREEEEAARAAFGRHPRRTVAAVRTYPAGLPGPASATGVAAFAALLLVQALLTDGTSFSRLVLVGVLLLTAGGPVGRGLLRRVWLDRERPAS